MQLPTAVLWQNGPLLWIHPNASPAKVIDWYPDAVASLAIRGIKLAISHFGRCHVPHVPLAGKGVQQQDSSVNNLYCTTL